MNLVLPIFAGLGLFFIGIRLISRHLKQLVGPRMRLLLGRALAGHRTPALFGFVVGAVLQSVNAVALTLAALVSARVIEPRAAFPIINWANLGTAVIVLVAAVDLNLLVLVLIGATGVAYYANLDQSAQYRHVVGAVLGIGLLFLGIDLTKAGAAPLKEVEWLREYLLAVAGYDALGFAIGVAVTLIAQSSTKVTIVAMAMATTGLLGLESGTMVVLGAGLGSGLTALWMVGSMKGSARQLMLYQFALKFSGVMAMLLLLAIEQVFGWPLLQAFLLRLGTWGLSSAMCLATVFVLLQVVADVVMNIGGGRIERLVERFSPATQEEILGVPHYLEDHSLNEPEAALLLVDKEQQRLLMALPAYLDPLRADARQPGPSTRVRHAADGNVAQQCDLYLKDIADRAHSRVVLERTIVLRDRNGLIISIQEALAELCELARGGEHPEFVHALIGSLVEGLHVTTEALAHCAAAPDPQDLEMLRLMTHDRSELMDSIRRRMVSAGDGISHETQQLLFSATSLFERSMWLLRRYVLLLDVPVQPTTLAAA
jgi:phosphate:Na+ symporter